MQSLSANRERLWLMGVVGGVLLLFLAPWVWRELRPLSSQALFQEARGQLGMLARYPESHARAAGSLARALIDIGEPATAVEFVNNLPPPTQTYVRHYLILALLDAGHLDDALRLAPKQLSVPDYGLDGSSSARRDLFVRITAELLAAGRYADTLRTIEWMQRTTTDDTANHWLFYLAVRAGSEGNTAVAQQALRRLRGVFRELATTNLSVPDLPARIRRGIEKRLPPSQTPSDAVVDALQQLALHEPLAFYIFLFASSSNRIRQTDSSMFGIDFAASRLVLAGNWRGYSAVLTLWQKGFFPNPDKSMERTFLPRRMFWQQRYDPRLTDWLLSLPSDEDMSFDFAFAAAAAAQAGAFDDAKRLLQHAGDLSRDLRDIYSAGYAVGLAKQGKFRQAAREARRIPSPEYRVCALARIAAEMKKRGL
ncbi:MAG: hypothetical protein NZ556_00600 [Fimbriimonadales bacterium]|nr:hypothetical protein [Fimbriimonadales bacterium]